MFSFVALFVGVGFLFLLLAIPLIQQRVKPNGWYGFRTRKTLNNEAIWYKANAFSGKQFYRSGLTLIFAAFTLALVPGIHKENYALLCGTVISLELIRNLVVSFRYLRTL